MSIATQFNALRALVVDDEAVIRRFMTKSLTKEGFSCDTAENGEEAAKLATEKSYDLVVTDLALPRRNGHSLALDLLGKSERPVVVVVTGVLEPRITKDLMARGVDDIMFKPVEFTTLAAKARSLVDRRRKLNIAPATKSHKAASSCADKIPRVTSHEFESRLGRLSRVPSVSKAAIEVFNLTTNPDSGVREVSAAVQRDPALIAEIFRLVNSSFFNPSSTKINNLNQAIKRLGQKHVGELALATAAFATVAQETIPFFPLSHIWRECLAAGICLELLAHQTTSVATECSNLFCAAVLSPMGRVMLASLFPDVYQQLINYAAEERLTLADLEARVFPESTGDVVARALASWGIPDEVFGPLRHVSKPFHALPPLKDPFWRQVALVKMAGLLGKLGADRWEKWDTVDLPSASVLKPLGIHTVDRIVSQCRDDLEALTLLDRGHSHASLNRTPSQTVNTQTLLAYKRVQNEEVDLLPHLLATAGIRLVNTVSDISDIEGTVLVNTFDAPVDQVVAGVCTRSSQEILIFADAENSSLLQKHGRVLSFPMSYGALREACISGCCTHG